MPNGWKPRRAAAKLDWEKFLTVEEKRILRKAAEAKAQWQNCNRERAKIVNRAIHRAKYEAAP